MKKKKTFIMAEAGINHNGSFKKAIELIKKAKEINADAIKFQTFIAENIVTLKAPKAGYQKNNISNNETQYSMIKKLQLSFDEFEKLYRYCKKIKIEFISSAFDLESLFFLKKLGIRIFKIPSGEITNLPYLELLGKFNKKIILSSGMSNMMEIKKALKILINNGTVKKNITVLHCHSGYPTSFEDVNLFAMQEIKRKLNIEIGYSDHTNGIEVSLAAVSLGAKIIEKHFTLNKLDKGPDHKASLDPVEFKSLVESIRNIEKCFGTNIKIATRAEKSNMLVVRKSLIASKDIKIGEKFTSDNIAVKRPGTGISPMNWYKFIGKKAKKNFKKDSLIS